MFEWDCRLYLCMNLNIKTGFLYRISPTSLASRSCVYCLPRRILRVYKVKYCSSPLLNLDLLEVSQQSVVYTIGCLYSAAGYVMCVAMALCCSRPDPARQPLHTFPLLPLVGLLLRVRLEQCAARTMGAGSRISPEGVP